jgi:hypothetical protein
MTVCRRAVASWKPQSVGFSGLDRVGTRKTGVKVPPPTPGSWVAAGYNPQIGVKVVSPLADLLTPFQGGHVCPGPGTAELAQLLMNAATHLSSLDGARRPLVPAGIPIRRGRLHLGRLRSCLDGADTVAVSVGFASAAWVGRPTESAPNLGRLGYRSEGPCRRAWPPRPRSARAELARCRQPARV